MTATHDPLTDAEPRHPSRVDEPSPLPGPATVAPPADSARDELASAPALPEVTGVPARVRRRLHRELAEAVGYRSELRTYDDVELRRIYDELRDTRAVTEAPGDRALCFAVVREVARRTLGMEPYEVQLLAGLAIAESCIAEQATGEGKTLSATLPVAWWATSQKTVHVATANDYLAARDAALMAPLYEALGLSVGVSPGGAPQDVRQAAYRNDIVYSTAQQLGFDFLGDRMARNVEDFIQDGHFAVVVDEADSLLIDEARNPLIVSGPDSRPVPNFPLGLAWARTLNYEVDYLIDFERKEAVLTPVGVSHAEEFFGVEHLYAHPDLAALTYVCLRAQVLYERDRDYIVVRPEASGPSVTVPEDEEDAADAPPTRALDADGELHRLEDQSEDTGTGLADLGREAGILIVDENSGRALPGRRYQEGLHEALEAKEGLPVRPFQMTYCSVTIPAYFSRYAHFGGMTGTAATDAAELLSTYNTPVAQIPTHRPRIRLDHPDRLYLTKKAKLGALVAEVTRRHKAGQPVLVGSPTITDSLEAAAVLADAGLRPEVLSARHHAEEAKVIAQAGRPGAITVATNMAGRGVDIILGGDPAGLLAHDPSQDWSAICVQDRGTVLAAGGLCVIGTARHEARRIDNQLRGRAGRQGEPGESLFLLSCEDDIIVNFGGAQLKTLLGHGADIATAAPLSAPALTKLVARCQSKIEGYHAEQRMNLMKFDRVVHAQREAFWNWRRSLFDLDLSALFEVIATGAVEVALGNLDTQTPTLDELSDALGQSFPFALAPEQVTTSDLTAARRSLVTLVTDRLAKKYTGLTPDLAELTVRHMLLSHVDTAWARQLQDLDLLQQATNLRSHATQDPATAFSLEAPENLEEHLDAAFRAVLTQQWRVTWQQKDAEGKVLREEQPLDDSGNPLPSTSADETAAPPKNTPAAAR